MATEIERKFLLKDNTPSQPEIGIMRGEKITQFYISTDPDRVVRVRISHTFGEAFLTVKGKGHLSRPEFEYSIPIKDAIEMLESGIFVGVPVEKIRYHLNPVVYGYAWEVDIFRGANFGLETVELELPSEAALFTKPEWLGAEITHDPKYKNNQLALNPFTRW